MGKFINSKKEIFLGERFFKVETQPDEYDGSAYRKAKSAFWASHGFDVSAMYANFYSYFSGIESDKYFSDDLYYFYALPTLNRQDFMWAYTDKNIADQVFRGFRQPETILKNVNGIFVDKDGEVVSKNEAMQICLDHNASCIVKPTVNGGSGVGVAKVNLKLQADVEDLFNQRRGNYIIQRVLKQHSDMASLNDSSVNTIRIFTYRDLNGVVHYVKGHSFIRFGKKGAAMDNVAAGGVLCSIDDNGIASDKYVGFNTMTLQSLSENFGIVNFKVPSFDKAVDFAKRLHGRLFYFDYVGWDIAVGEDGEPVYMEFNLQPTTEGDQMASGPSFGEFLDEVVERMKHVEKAEVIFSRRYFRPGFDHLLQIGGPDLHNWLPQG